MRHILTSIFLLSTIQFLYGQTKSDKIQVLILGSYHMGQYENGRDILNSKKQNEVSNIVNQLSLYQPDKIFVESNPENQAGWDIILSNYKKGISPKDTFSLAMETFQLGVKLAEKLNLNRVHTVNYDWPNTQDTIYIPTSNIESAYIKYLKEIYVVAKTVPDKDWYSETLMKTDEEVNEVYRNINKIPLTKTLLLMNTADNRRKMTYVGAMANMDNDPKGIGAEMTNIQVLRNLKIFQNIINRVEKNTKRILIIYGAAHNEPLRNLFEMNPRYEMIELDKYLK